MLRKILEVFITKKFSQYKISRTLKIDSPEIPDNKDIGKLFSKYELLFLDQANSSSDPSQRWTLRFPTPRASLPPSLSLFKVYPSQQKSLFNTILITFFIGFPILSYPMQPHTTTVIGYTKPYGKPTQSNLLSSCTQIIIPYGSNRLPIKKLNL